MLLKRKTDDKIASVLKICSTFFVVQTEEGNRIERWDFEQCIGVNPFDLGFHSEEYKQDIHRTLIGLNSIRTQLEEIVKCLKK